MSPPVGGERGRLSEDKIIDREDEADEFEALLRAPSARRVVCVSEGNGRGKTELLRKLRSQCDYRFKVVGALVPLEDYCDRPDEFEVVADIGAQLQRAGASLPRFEEHYRAAAVGDVDSLMAKGRIVGTVDATAASFGPGATLAGINQNITDSTVINAPRGALSEEARYKARQLCIEAFLEDLDELAATAQVVIFLDTVDRANDEIQRWIFRDLLMRRALDDKWRGTGLILVVAGVDLFEGLEKRFGAEICAERVARPALGSWGHERVAEFLTARVRGPSG